MAAQPRLIITTLSIAALALTATLSFAEERAKANFSHSDIFVFDLDLSAKEGALSGFRQATARRGYDNQPFFTPDSRALLFARGDDYQTDVYEYSLASGAVTQLTATAEMEFSPTPNEDNGAIAYVSDSDGSVWMSQRDSIDQRSWVFEDSKNPESVGYFAWNFATDQMLYWSRFAYSVVLFDHAKGERHFVSGNAPPASPRIIPGSNKFSFVHRQANQEVWIKEFDPDTKALRPLIRVEGENNNYAWAPGGFLLMIQGTTLHRAQPAMSPSWMPIADLSAHGVQDAKRIAVSSDGLKLAVVGVSAPTASQ